MIITDIDTDLIGEHELKISERGLPSDSALIPLDRTAEVDGYDDDRLNPRYKETYDDWAIDPYGLDQNVPPGEPTLTEVRFTIPRSGVKRLIVEALTAILRKLVAGK